MIDNNILGLSDEQKIRQAKNEYQTAWRRLHPEKVKEYTNRHYLKKWDQEHPEGMELSK